MQTATVHKMHRPVTTTTVRDPFEAGDNHVVAEALNATAAYLRERDPQASVLLAREEVGPVELESAAVLAEVGAMPGGLTVFASSEHHQRVLARVLCAAVLPFGAVGAPGGMAVVIYAGPMSTDRLDKGRPGE